MNFGGPVEDAAPLDAPAPVAAVETDAQPPAVRPGDEVAAWRPAAADPGPAPRGWPVWLVASVVAALWALAPIAFALGYRSRVAPLTDDSFALMVFALLAIGPAVFVFGAAYLIRQSQRLAHEARRSQAMAEEMLAPALVAAARAGDVTSSIREEIRRASSAAEDARETLGALREALALEVDKLAGATAQSVRTAEDLTATLGRERSEMGDLAKLLDAQALRVVDSITEQARMVTEATGVAEAQIREAETALAARAADLAAAAAEASGAARTAGEDLTRHIARLETAGVGVADQVRAVEAGLTEQRTALVALSRTLRDDHGEFAAQAEAHAARLGDFIETARRAADEMGERASSGGETLRKLVSDAVLQFRDIAETAKAEREEFGQSTLHALEAVSSAAAEQRSELERQTRSAIEALAKAAEETREAAARHAAAARDQVDQLSEAAFGAGQKANQVFEARLEEARALIEQSSKMVEDAGAETARKLSDGAAAARETLDELKAMMDTVESRASDLPAVAARQAEQVRAAVADGMEELMAQARRTAEQANAIDSAFQERVRRNFEMLSEAVRLMGIVSTAAPPAAPVEPPPPMMPAAVRAPVAPEPPAADDDEPLALDTPVTSAPSAPAEDAGADPGDGAAELAERLGLRNRIRLTPTATDREFSEVFQAAAGRPAPPPPAAPVSDDGEAPEEGGGAWTWKDLLASIDGGEGPRLEDQLAGELARMGVEPARLLPDARVAEIADLMNPADPEAAREVVRRLAPAATRRIARRLFTDDDVKSQAEMFVRRYRTLMGDAEARDPTGAALGGLLASDAGRMFLLIDGAAGDMI